jgi:type IV pilus assembly protein PilM
MKLKFRIQPVIQLVIRDYVFYFMDMDKTNPMEIARFGEIQLPTGSIRHGKIEDMVQLRTHLQRVIQQEQLQKRHVQFTLPDDVFVVRQMRIPNYVQERDFKGYVYMELESSLSLPLRNPVLELVKINSDENGHDVILIATEKAILEAYLALFTSVGWEPIVGDISPLSIYRVFYKYALITDIETVLNIQVNRESVHMSIFREHNILFTYQFQFEEEGMPLQYLIIENIEQIKSYYENTITEDGHFTKVLLSGDLTEINTLKELICSLFDVAVVSTEDVKVQTKTGSVIPSQHLVGYGLSIRGAV